MNDLVQLHTGEPLTAAGISRALAERVDRRWLHRWARLEVALAGPWRPADRWPGGLERLVWTAAFRYPDGGFFTPEGEALAGHAGRLLRRQAPVHPAELLGPAFASALVLWHSDAGRTACVSVWRERHLRWSLRVDDHDRLVRCDGQAVVVEAPPRHFPEGDRTGVCLAGWQRFLGEFPPLEGVERLTFVDTLESLTADAPWQTVYAGGAWAGEVVRGRAHG